MVLCPFAAEHTARPAPSTVVGGPMVPASKQIHKHGGQDVLHRFGLRHQRADARAKRLELGDHPGLGVYCEAEDGIGSV